MTGMKKIRAIMAQEFERQHVKPKDGRVLVVGSRVYPGRDDRRKRYADVIGVDMLAGEGVDVVLNLEDDINIFEKGFAHVDCISVLEHSRRPWAFAANVTRMLEPGGTIFVQTPFVWWVHGYPSDYWRFTAEAIKELFPEISWSRMAYIHHGMTPVGEKLPRVDIENWPHFPRTELCCFGARI